MQTPLGDKTCPGLQILDIAVVLSSNGMVGFGYSYPLRTHSLVIVFSFVPTGQTFIGLSVVGGCEVGYTQAPEEDITCPGAQVGLGVVG